MTANVHNTKIGEIENKNPDGIDSGIDYNIFTDKIIDTKLKLANLATISDIHTVSQQASKNGNK